MFLDRLRCALLCVLIAAASTAEAAPRVFVTVAPVHSIAAAVMEGVGEPYLLLPAGTSPHAFAVKPSQMRALRDADVVIWVGETLETFLRRAMASPEPGQRIIEMMAIDGIRLDPARRGSDFEAHDHDHAHDHDEPVSPARANPHVWLDPANMLVLARELTAVLVELDPGNAARYRANAAAIVERVEKLDAEISAALRPVQDQPFIVFHDAYQAFERRYALRAVGAVTVSPDRPPGAARLRSLREKIGRLDARCVFTEPQYEPRVVRTIVEGTGARAAELDPLGSAHPPGPDAWFRTMRALTESLRGCLLSP